MPGQPIFTTERHELTDGYESRSQDPNFEHNQRMNLLTHFPQQPGSPRVHQILPKGWERRKRKKRRPRTINAVSSLLLVILHDRAYRIRRISQGNARRSLSIVILIVVIKRFFNCIQLALVVETYASLTDFKFPIQSGNDFSQLTHTLV